MYDASNWDKGNVFIMDTVVEILHICSYKCQTKQAFHSIRHCTSQEEFKDTKGVIGIRISKTDNTMAK